MSCVAFGDTCEDAFPHPVCEVIHEVPLLPLVANIEILSVINDLLVTGTIAGFSAKMTEVAGKVLGVAKGGNTATGTVPGGARAMAVVAWGVVAAGGTPPPELLMEIKTIFIISAISLECQFLTSRLVLGVLSSNPCNI